MEKTRILNGSEVMELELKYTYWDRSKGIVRTPTFRFFTRRGLEITHIEGSDEWIFKWKDKSPSGQD